MCQRGRRRVGAMLHGVLTAVRPPWRLSVWAAVFGIALNLVVLRLMVARDEPAQVEVWVPERELPSYYYIDSKAKPNVLKTRLYPERKVPEGVYKTGEEFHNRYTLAPLRANLRALSRPMPPEAPISTTTWSSTGLSFMVSPSCFVPTRASLYEVGDTCLSQGPVLSSRNRTRISAKRSGRSTWGR
jgi:type IV secretory pathway TrbD component